jgi:hypothetical protein
MSAPSLRCALLDCDSVIRLIEGITPFQDAMRDCRISRYYSYRLDQQRRERPWAAGVNIGVATF